MGVFSPAEGGKMDFVSLKYDFSFKALMMNEEVRKYFISDVLDIPVERLKSVKLINTYLWRRYREQKQGIVDVLVELDDHSKVNIELQIKMIKNWDKRNLFYLSKLFTSDLLVGENYSKLKRCVCISILDFNLDERPEYHKIYRLRDKQGYEYSDMFEIHIIELRKRLKGDNRMDEWISLLNAKSKEELDMIQTRTKNPGILAAIREVKVMGLGKNLWMLYEAHMKEIRDRNAREEYVFDEGLAAGKAEGKAEAILDLLSEVGDVPIWLCQLIQSQQDEETLRHWLKVAAKAESVEGFCAHLQITLEKNL